MRLVPLSLFALVLFGARSAPLAQGATASSMPARPNVVLIMPDDVSWDDFSTFNAQGPRTPAIDALARTSVRFTDFHVSPTCSPTRAALMTGRYNNATGVWHTILGRYFLRPDETTMADILKANGYRTALFGKWHLGDAYPFRPQDRGFEHSVMHRGGGIDQQHNPWGNRDLPPATLFVNDRPVPLATEPGASSGAAYSTDFFTTHALDYIRARTAAREPFFAYLAYNVAHVPHDAPPDARPGVAVRTAAIENLDRNVGRILRHLDDAGLASDTLVVFLTDNGMASRALRGGKATHHEGGHRVPCFIRWPAAGIGGAERDARDVPLLTAHIDLLPTLIDLLGLRDTPNRSPGTPLHGLSLRSALTPAHAGHSLAFSALRSRVLTVDNQRMDALVPYRQASVMRNDSAADGIPVRQWRLISGNRPKTWELYDLVADPKQARNLAAADASAPIVAALSAAYEAWWSEVSAHAGDYIRPVLGSAAEPTTCLYSHDWHTEDNVPWNHTMVAEGLRANGVHTVEFARGGVYSFDLRRWPREISDQSALTSALAEPIRAAKDNVPVLGTALPIRAARLRIWQEGRVVVDRRQSLAPEADGAEFIVTAIPTGPASIQTWFYDEAGQEICGAYYTYVAPR